MEWLVEKGAKWLKLLIKVKEEEKSQNIKSVQIYLEIFMYLFKPNLTQRAAI